ncbi:MAG: molybdopterin-dependent oxidoreductase [Candidatus Aenigmarchaeota archaeon]|nr:molybdopterin-dependent oxidoreductase [Candidatus Aenigmarchaeota archaeon]
MKKLVLLLAIVLVAGCIQQPIELEGVEVRNYEGQDLSSIQDFRENSIKGPQYIDIDSYTLEISGLVNNPKDYTYSEIINRQTYKKVVRLDCVEGWSVNILWEGILLRELIQEVDPTQEANTIILYAEDGYSTSFPIEYIMENDIILAHKQNDLTLAPERGFPFQLVAEEKWGYKWIKWITKIELSDDENYTGYWESKGYSDTEDRDKSFRDFN